MTIYADNDNLITLTSLQNQIDDSYENAATVTYVLADPSGTTVTTGSMTYVTGSDGNYQATLEEDLSLTLGTIYTLTITADNGSDVIGKWTTTLQAQTRTL